jgi:hypothetical protein
MAGTFFSHCRTTLKGWGRQGNLLTPPDYPIILF